MKRISKHRQTRNRAYMLPLRLVTSHSLPTADHALLRELIKEVDTSAIISQDNVSRGDE